MKRNSLKFMAATMAVTLMMSITACGNTGDVTDITTESKSEVVSEVEAESKVESEVSSEVESETETEVVETLTEYQNLKSSYIDVGTLIGEYWKVGYQPIPEICKWDEDSRSFIASDNGRNENGESIIVSVSCESISRSETFIDNLNRLNTMLESNKDTYTEYDLEYDDGSAYTYDYEVIAYYYVTEEIEVKEEREYVHTVGVFELLRYKRTGCIDPYTRTTFTVDIVKPVELTQNSVSSYFEDVYDAITIGYTQTMK